VRAPASSLTRRFPDYSRLSSPSQERRMLVARSRSGSGPPNDRPSVRSNSDGHGLAVNHRRQEVHGRRDHAFSSVRSSSGRVVLPGRDHHTRSLPCPRTSRDSQRQATKEGRHDAGLTCLRIITTHLGGPASQPEKPTRPHPGLRPGAAAHFDTFPAEVGEGVSSQGDQCCTTTCGRTTRDQPDRWTGGSRTSRNYGTDRRKARGAADGCGYRGEDQDRAVAATVVDHQTCRYITHFGQRARCTP